MLLRTVPGMDRTPAASARRLEPMALACLLVAAVGGWCPLTALAAVVLGGLALRRIGRAPERLRGRGLALAGMALATAIVLAEAWWLGELQSRTLAAMDDQAVAAIQAAVAGNAAPEQLSRHAGAVRGVTITRREVSGLADPTISVAFNVEGERGTAFGVAEFTTVPGTLPPALRMRSLRGTAGDQAFEVTVPAREETSK